MAKYIAYNVKTKEIHSQELSLTTRTTLNELTEMGFSQAKGWKVLPKSQLFKDKSPGSDFHQMTWGLPNPTHRVIKDSQNVVIGIQTQARGYHYDKMSNLLISQCFPQGLEVDKLSDIDFINLYNSKEV